MTVVSMLGGVLAYTRTGSVPSILASFTIGGALAMSSMRIKDGLDYGIEGAACMPVSIYLWNAASFPTSRRFCWCPLYWWTRLIHSELCRSGCANIEVCSHSTPASFIPGSSSPYLFLIITGLLTYHSRAIRVRAPIPAVISLLALSSTAYYTKSALDRQSK